MKKILSLALSFSAALLFSGCGSAIGNLHSFSPVPLQKTEFMPTREEVKSGRSKIVMFKIDDGGFDAGKRANVGESLYVEIARILTQGGTVEILDRNVADKLEDEIRLAELSGKMNMEDDALAVARYAVAAEISNASFSSRYIAASSWYDKKGILHVIPAHYIYTASLSGLIKIYAIPSMKLLKTIELNDNKSRRENSRFLQKGQQFDAGLINGAARDAVYAARIELKNFFAPKGYIMEKRTDGSQSIFQVTIGRLHGLGQGDDVNIYTLASMTNPLTGENDIVESLIATGKVSEQITDTRAWIILDEEDPLRPVHLGDYVKVEYKKGALDYLNDFGRGYNSLLK